MQVKVPQQLLEYEDKIIGPLTLKQFIFILVGIGVGFVVYLIFPPSLKAIGFILAFPAAVLFFAMAFVKFNERSLDQYVLAGISMVIRPRFRVWARELSVEGQEPLLSQIAPPKKTMLKPGVGEIRTNLEQLAHVMDTRGHAEGQEIISPTEQRIFQPIEKRVLESEEEPYKETIEAEDALTKADQRADELEEMFVEAEEKKAVEPTEPNIMSVSKPVKHHEYEKVKLSETDYKDILEMAQRFVEKKNDII